MGVVMQVEFGKLTDYCDKAALLLSDATPLMADTTWAWGSALVTEHFEQERDAFGSRWPAISPGAFKSRKRNKDPNNYKILQDTGLLLNSLTSGEYERTAVLAANNKVEFGTNVVYAGTHEYGHKGVPQRSYMPAGPDEGLLWQQAIADAIKERLEALGID